MKRLSYFSPIFVAIFTVTSLYAANAARLEWSQIVIPLVFAIAVAGLFMLLFWLLKWTSKSMPIVASMFIFASLTWYVMPIWVDILLILYALFVGIQKYLKTNKATFILAFVMILAILFTTGQALIINATNQVKAETTTIGLASPDVPNIYFIIPDRMPSIEAMRESKIECDQFLTTLKQRGFYVKENQLSGDEYSAIHPQNVHTTRTMRYFAAVLNGGIDIPLEISYKNCSTLIKSPEVFSQLHAKGYTIYNVASWFAETSKLPADYSLHFKDISFLERLFQDELSVAFYERTILRGINFRLLELDASTNNIEKNRHTWQAEQIIELSQLNASTQGLDYGRDGPVFVMAHILLPHEPFVWCDSNASQSEQYYQQIKYTQTYLINLIDGIRTADPKSIIIIQSDEGMAYKKPVELNYALSPVQWNGVLTAWYIPGADILEINQLRHTEILKYVLENR